MGSPFNVLWSFFVEGPENNIPIIPSSDEMLFIHHGHTIHTSQGNGFAVSLGIRPPLVGFSVCGDLVY
jgi:hypothetical protein